MYILIRYDEQTNACLMFRKFNLDSLFSDNRAFQLDSDLYMNFTTITISLLKYFLF